MSADRKFVHDMKNMLGIILGYSTLLLDELSDDDPKRIDVLEIRTAADAALAMLAKFGESAGDPHQ